MKFLHVEASVHLDRALVYEVDGRALGQLSVVLLQALLVCLVCALDDCVTDLLAVLLLLFFVFIEDGLVYLFCLLLALVETVVVSADNQNAKVDSEVANVNMKDELLRDTWNANWCPCFSTILHAWVRIDIVQQYLDVLGLEFRHLFRIGEDTNRIHRTDKHAASEGLWKVSLYALLYHSPCLIWHS